MWLDLTRSIIQSSRDEAAVSCLDFSGSRVPQSPLHVMARLVEGSPCREQTEPERQNAPAGAAGETTLQAEALMSSARRAAPQTCPADSEASACREGLRAPQRGGSRGPGAGGAPGQEGVLLRHGAALTGFCHLWRRLLART